MDLARTEEQAELASILASLLSKRAGSDAVREAFASEHGYDVDLWATMCEQIGVAALAVPEEYDGAGFGIAEALVALEELGRSLAPSPLLGSLMATEALLASGNSDACARLLPRIAAGEVASVALDGRIALFGGQAEILLAVDGDRLLELPAGSATRTPALDLTLQLATVDLASGTELASDPTIATRVHDVALVGTAAMQVGTIQRALDDTVAYAQQRVQFGRPIGSFQAIKHRLADVLVRVEMSRSALMAASSALTSGSDDVTERAAVAASYCSESLTLAASEMVQLHGGIAITWEHDAHLVFKRAHSLGTLWGLPHQHRARIAL